jgi:hypothetical protein
MPHGALVGMTTTLKVDGKLLVQLVGERCTHHFQRDKIRWEDYIHLSLKDYAK